MGGLRRARAAVLILSAMASLAAPVAAQDSPVRPRTVYEDLQMFSQVLNQIRVNHPDSLDSHALFMAAVEGMVNAADPHSYVIPAARLSREKEEAMREGRLVPLPVAFRYVGGAPVVVAVAPGSEATALDILPGDELVAIEGESVIAGSAAELDLVLAGPEDGEVTLTLRRRRLDGSLATLERVVRRERVDAETGVPTAVMLDDSTGYARITTFATEDVARDLDEALQTLEEQEMTGLVLDLRDNGGGLIDEAADVAAAFLPRGALVYTTFGRKEAVIDTVKVRRAFWKAERDYPVVLLVNEGTASASELLAGALQDHDRALVAGRPTFGKALVMQGFPLTDGSLMMLVIAKARTPCGRTVQRDYRSVSAAEYYRAAADARDRAGRESCTTDGGRTVYGGGGIYPDLLLDERPAPRWLARLREEHLFLRWVPGFAEARADLYDDLDRVLESPHLPPDDLQAFLDFARDQGVEVPDDPDARTAVERAILERILHIRFGSSGLYRFRAFHDPEVTAAVDALTDAARLPGRR